jgi:hypothetical protein
MSSKSSTTSSSGSGSSSGSSSSSLSRTLSLKSNISIPLELIDKYNNVSNLSINTFEANCIRKKSNLSKGSSAYKFDSGDFNPEKLLIDIPSRSPKLETLLNKIEELDKKDMAETGHLFKHFIFSEIKTGIYGAKLITAGLIAKGMTLGYNAPIKSTKKMSIVPVQQTGSVVKEKQGYAISEDGEDREDGKNGDSDSENEMEDKIKNNYGKIELLNNADMKKTINNNFYLLSSVDVYNQPINVILKKNILSNFNKRPDNIHGEYARIIVMDSGYKEGIDLFDIKHIHIFEPTITNADQKQIIGRGTRTCGQKGLIFHPTQGWILNVFIYDLDIPTSLKPSFIDSDSAFELYLKSVNIDLRLYNFNKEIERVTILGSVDYDLNLNIHNFINANNENNISSISRSRSKSVSRGRSNSKSRSNKTNRTSISSISSGNSSSGSSSSGSSSSGGSSSGSSSSGSSSSGSSSSGSSSSSSGSSSNSSSSGSSSKTSSRSKKRPIQIMPDNNITENRLMLDQLIQIRQNISQNRNSTRLHHDDMKDYVQSNFKNYEWDKIKIENACIDASEANVEPEKNEAKKHKELIEYSPSQKFIRHYFTPENPIKGMLLYHSVGTGKTCSAIAAATTSFEKQGYTILWVTRTTLKNDIWKNMFDQVCNETIREKIENGLVIPPEHAKRMKLLSPSWSIRPMSYKQFTNMISKENSFYDALVKKNGTADPLQKTLLIIDEAHKLYGGDGTLNALERPNMQKLQEALVNSYNISGSESVKLLLMTATPITTSPMELIQLLNLCKPFDEQMPSIFEDFADKYLEVDGKFSGSGETAFLNDISGYVSYLNREQDLRQFAQPVITYIKTPIIANINDIKQYDKKFVKEYMESDIPELKIRLEDNLKQLEGDLGDLDVSKFGFLKDKCKEYTGKAKKRCEKVVNTHIRELLKEAKRQAVEIRENIKSIRQEIKNKNSFKISEMKNISDNILNNPEKYEEFKKTVYYNLKYECGKMINTNVVFSEFAEQQPVIAKYNKEIREYDNNIEKVNSQLNNRIDTYKNRMKQLKEMLLSDITKFEKNIIRLNMKDEQKLQRGLNGDGRKKMRTQVLKWNKDKADIIKKKTVKIAKIRQVFKKMVRNESRVKKEMKRNEKKLNRTLRKQGDYTKQIEHQKIIDIVERYSELIDDDLEKMQGELDDQNKSELEKQASKLERARIQQEKRVVREEKAAERQAVKEAKVIAKENAKEEKAERKRETERVKARALREKNETKRKALELRLKQKTMKVRKAIGKAK